MGGGKSQRTGQRSVHRMFSKKPLDAGNLLAAGPIYMDVQAVRTGVPVRSGSAVQNHKEKERIAHRNPGGADTADAGGLRR